MSKAESTKVILPGQPRGPDWWRSIAEEQGHNRFLIAFSRGKDSVAMALALRDAGFDLYPFAMIGIPGLSFIDESLAYYEQELFGGRHIERVLYHQFARILNEGAYQLPDMLPVCERLNLQPDMAIIQPAIARKLGLPETTQTAIGVRATDNLLRRKLIVINGPRAVKKRQFYAIWDWNIDRITKTIAQSGVKLPTDYQMWGGSWGEIMPEMLMTLRDHYPDDYRKVLEWFPLCEAEAFRWDNMRE